MSEQIFRASLSRLHGKNELGLMVFEKVDLIGLGLIGSSTAKALKEKRYYVATVKSKFMDLYTRKGEEK